jgi:hypothetical protein
MIITLLFARLGSGRFPGELIYESYVTARPCPYWAISPGVD